MDAACEELNSAVSLVFSSDRNIKVAGEKCFKMFLVLVCGLCQR
jgi:hypothetical protein